MAINNILDMIAEGVRESNPVYRDKQKQLQEQQARMAEITQQQLFQQTNMITTGPHLRSLKNNN